jgi:hypothetical protein
LYPYTEPNLANFTNLTADSNYEIQAAISQYLIDNVLYELHKNGLIDIDTGDALNTTLSVGLISLSAGGTWTGFDSNAPCKFVIKSLDPYPKLSIHPVMSNFAANLSMALWCRRNDTP